jgi:ubiquinone/menaquinone biosynthesis C-methylase UbiE
MKNFRYVLDPLCLAAILAYGLNRWFLTPIFASPFLHGTFNDLLLIPAALPPLLWMQRGLGWRKHDGPPTPGEILGHWAIWSLVCEGLAPRFLSHAVADFHDVIAYAAGALVAGLWWNRRKILSRAASKATGFDGLARFYDGMENVLAGRKLIRCREAFLTVMPPPRRVLLLGEGHGRFLSALLKIHPEINVTCVDASAKMLAVTRRRLQRSGQSTRLITFLRRDLLQWDPPAQAYDLIVTQFVLDCFPPAQLTALMSRLATAAQPGARWLVSDFHLPELRGWRRLRASAILWVMYRFFRLVTKLPASGLTPPGPIFEHLGFQRLHHKEIEWGLLVSEIWQAPLEENSSPLCE